MTDLSTALHALPPNEITHHVITTLLGELPCDSDSVIVGILKSNEFYLCGVKRSDDPADIHALVFLHADPQRLAFGAMLRLAAAENGPELVDQRYLVGARVDDQVSVQLVTGAGVTLVAVPAADAERHPWASALGLQKDPRALMAS